MDGRVAELKDWLQSNQDRKAREVAYMWDTWNTQRQPWLNEKQEIRNYIFATDTTTTTNQTLPWKNRTTTPKICQIRDNLHANYLSAMFPNDNWLQWEAYTREDSELKKRQVITAYMDNKVRESNLRTTISRLILDYIDTGNAFATVDFVNETKTDPETEEEIPGYVGPRIRRISPYDIVFDPTAADFRRTPSIERRLLREGELHLLADQYPEYESVQDAVAKAIGIRDLGRRIAFEDWMKLDGYAVDGFGNYYEYLNSGYVEILEFEGHIYDKTTKKMEANRRIIVIDRQFILLDEPIPAWYAGTTRVHVGWRLRPDNLYGMGPLDNLIGMQYRIDHLENLKADVFDLIAFPPLKIKGDVQDFEWAPLERIIISDEDGDVEMVTVDTQALQADFQINLYEQKMEDMAGAPRQALGIRTPGEKTALEVQTLENNTGRIFQEKIVNFEVNLFEPLLNMMLETAVRNMNAADVVRVIDDDSGVQDFLQITKEDITARGKLRPIGARHFAQQNQTIQNLVGILGSPIGSLIQQHFSSIGLAKLAEDLIGITRYNIVSPNIKIIEDADTQQLINEASQQVQQVDATEAL